MTYLARGVALFPLLVAAAVGCSSSEDSPKSVPNTKFEPPGNGVPMQEAAACAALQKAEDDRRAALNCGAVTRPSCPGYLRKGNEACLQYDQGTVQGCVDFILGQASCTDVSSNQCVVKALAGTAPNGCDPKPDAGADAGSDAGTDAGQDAAPEASTEAGTDAASDATSDAALDAALDGGTD